MPYRDKRNRNFCVGCEHEHSTSMMKKKICRLCAVNTVMIEEDFYDNDY